jgi:hypothetical protein
MPQDKRTAQERGRLPATEAAALAALSVSESLMLAMVESGCLDPHVLRRCLLDAVTAHDQSSAPGDENAETNQAIHAETVKLIDGLLRQVDAVAPSRASPAGNHGHKAKVV